MGSKRREEICGEEEEGREKAGFVRLSFDAWTTTIRDTCDLLLLLLLLLWLHLMG